MQPLDAMVQRMIQDVRLRNGWVLVVASLALTGCASTSTPLTKTSIPSEESTQYGSSPGLEPDKAHATDASERSETLAVLVAGYSADQLAFELADEASGVPAKSLEFQGQRSANEFGLQNAISMTDALQHYSLADVEALALANNPTLSAAQALTRKSSGLRYQVGRSPNPLLGYFGQQLADRNTDQHGFFIEQDFVRGNKLQLNQEVLGHTQRAQQASADAQQYRILTDVRVRFFEAVAAQKRLDAATQFFKLARKGVQVAEELEQAAEGTAVATLQARTLLSEVALEQEQAEIAFRGAWNDLAAVAGIDLDASQRLVSDLTVAEVTIDWDIAHAEIVAQSPELAAARAVVCERLAFYRRQQAQPIPNLTAQLGAGYDNATDHGMINAMVSAPIPVWNKNCGNISAAYADYVRATKEVERIEQSIKSRLARASADFDSALRAVRKYEDEIIPQAERSLRLSEEAYGVGELGFLQVLIVRQNFFKSTLRLIDAQLSLAQAAAQVDGLLLSGALDSPADYTSGDGIRSDALGNR